jgi:serine/threonine protein kinase
MLDGTCPGCGARLDDSNAAGGLCARCLVARMLETVPDPPDTDDEEEDLFGPYHCIRKLGEGGMGVVYLAEQTEPLRRHVALKALKLGMDSRAVISRFETERHTLARMNHPNIARIFDAGTSRRGRPFFVMEYVDGAPLTEYCDRHLLTNGERLHLFAEVCGAVHHAHLQGVLHRDLKPSNILVAAHEGKPRVSIIDFGIAKATQQHLAERTFFTEVGRFIGTPEYMSPEQAGTSEAPLDGRTDVYSLGIVLYELLVGALPFDPVQLRKAGMAEILRIIREEEPLRPTTKLTTMGAEAGDVAHKRSTNVRALRHQIRGDLDLIVLKCLEKDPGRRYPSPESLALDIGRHLGNLPVLATGPDWFYRMRKWSLRRRRELVLAGIGGFCVAVAGASFTNALHRGVPDTPATVRPLTGYEGLELVPSIGPDGRVAFAWAGESGDNLDIYVVKEPGETPRRMTFDPASDSSPSWSPDGKWIAFARQTPDRRSRIMKVNAASGQETEVISRRSGFSPRDRTLAWSPDGRWLVSIDRRPGETQNGLHLISLETTEDRVLTAPSKGIEDMQPAWSRDGRRIAFVRDVGTADWAVWIQKLTADMRADGPPAPAPDGFGGSLPAWTPGGDLLFGAFRGIQRTMVWRLATGARKAVPLIALGERCTSPAVSWDGRKLVVEHDLSHSAVWRFDIDPASAVSAPRPFTTGTFGNDSPVFSPDGSQVVFGSDRTYDSQLWLADPSGRNPRQLTFGDPSRHSVWSPDGKRVYFLRGRGRAERPFSISAEGGMPTARPEARLPQAFSADGQWMYFQDEGLRLLRARTDGGGKPQLLTRGPVNWPRLTPDDQWVYFTVTPGLMGPLMRMPAEGGEPEQVISNVGPGNFFPARSGVYYTDWAQGQGRATLWFLPYGSKDPRRLTDIPRQTLKLLAVSSDGRILLTAVNDLQSDLLIADYPM